MRAILILAALFFPAAAKSEPFTGNFIYSICTSSDLSQQGACLGYYSGLTEGMTFGNLTGLSAAGMGSTMSFEEMQSFVGALLGYCVPDEATNQQILDVNVQYLRDNPELRHESARWNFVRAMKAAFPCPTE